MRLKDCRLIKSSTESSTHTHIRIPSHRYTHDSFNPSSKVAPSYQDILGGADDDENGEALAGVFAEADLGADEIPDGADADGFNAAEFGEEDHVRVRDGQEQLLWLERNAPAIDPILREMEGLGDDGEGEEDDAALYGSSSSSDEEEEEGETGRGIGSGGGGAGGLFGKRPGGAAASGAAFAEGFAALERGERAGSDTQSHSDYDGDDDDSEEE